MITRRQEELISYLKGRNDKTNAFVIMNEIGSYEVSDNPYKHDYCQELRNDVKCINESMETDTIILNNRKNEYWICRNEKELLEYLTPFRTKGVKSIQYYSGVLTKAMCNGQVKTDDYVTTRTVDIYESFSDKGNGSN